MLADRTATHVYIIVCYTGYDRLLASWHDIVVSLSFRPSVCLSVCLWQNVLCRSGSV